MINHRSPDAGHRRWGRILVLASALALAPSAASEAADRTAAARPRPPEPGIYHFKDLTPTDTARLNREKTFVILPVAMFQTHGPHLPSGTDAAIAEALINETAARLRKTNPEFPVLILPNLPVGAGSVNEQGYIFSHPSTMTLDPDVMLTFLYDWVLNVAEHAYWNLFIVSPYTGAGNMKVLDDACDFFTESYGMRTVNVMGLVMADSTQTAKLAAAVAKYASGGGVSDPLFEMDGGVLQTSMMLALGKEKVEPLFRELDPVPIRSFEELTNTAHANGWPGYFGAPAKATPELGREAFSILADACAGIISDTVAGIPWQSRPRLSSALNGDFWLREAVRASAAYQKIKRDRFEGWLKARRQAEEEARRNALGK